MNKPLFIRRRVFACFEHRQSYAAGFADTPQFAEAGVGREDDRTLPVSGLDETEGIVGGNVHSRTRRLKLSYPKARWEPAVTVILK